MDQSVIRESGQRRRAIFESEKHIEAVAVVETFGVVIEVALSAILVAPVALPLVFVRLLAFGHQLHLVGAISHLSEVLGEEGGIELNVVPDRVARVVGVVLYALVQEHVAIIPRVLRRVGHLENLGVRDVTLHTPVAHGQRIVTGLQALAPKLIVVVARRVGENFLRLGQRTVGGRLEVHAIAAGALFNVQSDATVGASRRGGHHVVGAHRGVEPLTIGSVERHRLIEILHHGLVVFVVEHGGTTGDFVRAGLQTNETLRHRGCCRFGHIGVRGTRSLGQRVVDLIHVTEGVGHNHRDFTVVLTLHSVALCREVELRARRRRDVTLHRLTGVATVDLRHFHREAGVGLLQFQHIRRIGRHHLVEQRRAVVARHFHAHGLSLFSRLHVDRRKRSALQAERRIGG